MPSFCRGCEQAGVAPACGLTRKELFDAKEKRVKEAMTAANNCNDAAVGGGGGSAALLFPKNLRLYIVHELEDGRWVCSECGHKIGVHAAESTLPDISAAPTAHPEGSRSHSESGEGVLNNQQLMNKFEALLRKGKTNPTFDFLAKSVKYFPDHLAAMKTPEDALQVYDDVKRLCGATSTRMIIKEEFGISLNGPMSEHTPNLVKGTRKRTNAPVMVKFLTLKDSAKMHQLLKEKLNGVPNLVQFEMITLRSDELAISLQKVQHAICMKHFFGTAWDLQETDDGGIALGIGQIVDCLQGVHRQNVVHMDVKPQNIFVNDCGDFLLGDFDACQILEEPRFIRTTAAYLPADMQQPPISFAVDWEMLLTTIAVLMKRNRMEELPPAPRRDIRDAVLDATADENLQAVIRKIRNILHAGAANL